MNALSKGSNLYFSISINSDSVTDSTFVIGLASTLSQIVWLTIRKQSLFIPTDEDVM